MALIIPNILNISKYFKWWSAPWVALVELSISFIFYEIFQIKYTMRWRWVSSGSYLNISKYFEYFLIFQVVECTLGGAGRAIDQFHIL